MSSPGEVVGTFLERYAAGDRDYWREVFAEDIVWDVARDQILGEPVYHGHDGVERFFVDWLGAWEGYEFEQLELLESGPYVLSVFRQRGRGKGSGIESTAPSTACTRCATERSCGTRPTPRARRRSRRWGARNRRRALRGPRCGRPRAGPRRR